MDPNRSFEKKYNRNGWPFMILANDRGDIVYQCCNLLEKDKTLLSNLKEIGSVQRNVPVRNIGGTLYLQSTITNSKMVDKTVNQRFTSIACNPDGKVYTTYTATENSNNNVYLKIDDSINNRSQVIPIAATTADEYDSTVIIDRKGQPVICWTSNTANGVYNVYVTSLRRLMNNSAPFAMSQTQNEAMHGRMAVDQAGNVWIAYYKWHNIKNISRDKEIYVRKVESAGISSEIRISPTDVSAYEDHTDPAIVIYNNQPVVCWSWDFHKPKGYTKEAEAPTIFARPIGQNGMPERIFNISSHDINMTPAMGVCGDDIWCVWDSLKNKNKSICLRRSNSQNTIGDIVNLSGDCVNVCSPEFAFYNNDKGVITWSQTNDGETWTMYKADYNAQKKTWDSPKAIVSEGNPRFGSCEYDSQGSLWLGYSVQNDKGREVVVKQWK